jgi:hypothetical protein
MKTNAAETNAVETRNDKPPTPPGWEILPSGTELKDGDSVWRHTFGQFIPFSQSQIKTCGHALACELVIRKCCAASESPDVVTSKGIGSVFLVVGSTGQYSDHTEWNVMAYPTEEQANAHRDAAQVVADSHKELARNYDFDFKNPHDPQYAIDYTGTSYRVEMIEVFSVFVPNNKGQTQ